MNRITRGTLLTLAGVVAACTQLPRRSEVATGPMAPPPVLDSPASLPAGLIVSTNEPFWQARVEGAVVTLTGPDRRRSFRVEVNEAVFDGRYVVARDAQGVLEARVAARLCQDSMAGSVFPYTARLRIDGETPVLGCARGLNDPQPTEPRH